MKKNSVIAELLYIGIVAEMGRCYGYRKGIFYNKILRRHIHNLDSLQKCLLDDKKDIFAILNGFINYCNSEKQIGKFYCFSTYDIYDISSSGRCCVIDNLINELFKDLIIEIDKTFINKKKVFNLLCVLHNLPRVYFGTEVETLCELRQPSISVDEAIKYSFATMNNDMLEKYNKFLIKDK